MGKDRGVAYGVKTFGGTGRTSCRGMATTLHPEVLSSRTTRRPLASARPADATEITGPAHLGPIQVMPCSDACFCEEGEQAHDNPKREEQKNLTAVRMNFPLATFKWSCVDSRGELFR